MSKPIIITRKFSNEVISGSLKMHMLTYDERIAKSKLSIIEVKAPEGQDQTAFEATQSLDRAAEYAKLATERCTEISFKIKTDELEMDCESIAELMAFQEGQDIVMDVAMALIAGITLGKKK